MPTRSRKFASTAVTALVFALAFSQFADARSLSGGRSMGRQSSTYSQRQAAPTATPVKPTPQQAAPAPAQATTTPAQPTPTTPPPRNRWLGPLAGIAAGLGMGALLSHFGMGGALGGGIGGLLLLGALVICGLMLFRRMSGAPAAGSFGGNTPQWPPEPAAPPTPVAPSDSITASAMNDWTIPAGFDVPGFQRQARVDFIRMQAAWDQGDLEDIRAFTTPEMFAEIRLELSDRGTAANYTDVVECTAELLGMEILTNGAQLASVLFTGTLREDVGAPAQPFREVWNFLRRDGDSSDWLLAGIQQDERQPH